MPASFDLKAGERSRILWIFSSSIPGTVRFRATPTGNAPLSGKVELRRGHWFSTAVEEHPLHAVNVFDKGFTDSDYRIHVTPDSDCRIEFETRHFRAEPYFLFLAAFLILSIVSGSVALMFAPR